MAWTISCIAIVIVAIQFIAKVLPWIYENIVGPWCLGPKFKLREYGEWACEYTYVICEIDLDHQFNDAIKTANPN